MKDCAVIEGVITDYTVSPACYARLQTPETDLWLNTLTDLMNALPGNSSVNTVLHATIDDAVFSMSPAPSSGVTKGLYNPFLSNGLVKTLPRKL
jgi:hypothetical protein